MELRNSGKSAKSSKSHKSMQNTSKFARNLIKYMSIQYIWNLSRLLGLFICRKLANLSWNFITRTSKQCPKTIRRKSCCEKLGTSHVKSFTIGSFLKRFVVKIANDYLCWKNIKLAHQINLCKINRFLAKLAQKNSHEITIFTDCFPKIPANMSLKIPRNLPFFRDLSD